VAEPTPPQPTARAATRTIPRREEQRDDEDNVLRSQLQAEHVDLADAIDLTESFAELVRQRQPEGLDSWLERAAKSGLAAFRRFAGGLRDDYEAVKAGLTLPWSTGPVEGQIIRLKMLKRQAKWMAVPILIFEAACSAADLRLASGAEAGELAK
jgi:transposase